jgi:hypothetical protein
MNPNAATIKTPRMMSLYLLSIAHPQLPVFSRSCGNDPSPPVVANSVSWAMQPEHLRLAYELYASLGLWSWVTSAVGNGQEVVENGFGAYS